MRYAWLLLLSVIIAGCDLVGDIFQAGVLVGVIAIILIVALIGWVLRRFRRH